MRGGSIDVCWEKRLAVRRRSTHDGETARDERDTDLVHAGDIYFVRAPKIL